eukprot:1362377-Amorphochlora_amoeboformis.AAC.1
MMQKGSDSGKNKETRQMPAEIVDRARSFILHPEIRHVVGVDERGVANESNVRRGVGATGVAMIRSVQMSEISLGVFVQ